MPFQPLWSSVPYSMIHMRLQKGFAPLWEVCMQCSALPLFIFFTKIMRYEGWHQVPLHYKICFNTWVSAGRGVTEAVWAVGFCLGSGLFGSCNSD